MKTGARPSGAKRELQILDAVLQADWQTPMASRTTPSELMRRGNNVNLPMQVVRADWPTATVCGNHNRKGASDQSGDGLATAVTEADWPTATARDWKSGESNLHGTNARPLNEVVLIAGPLPDSSMQTETLSPVRNTNGSRPGPLNAAWVAVLMGYPSDWADDETKPASSS